MIQIDSFGNIVPVCVQPKVLSFSNMQALLADSDLFVLPVVITFLWSLVDKKVVNLGSIKLLEGERT